MVLGNFQCRDVLLILIIIVGQGTTVLAEGVGGDCLDIVSVPIVLTARYRLKYYLK